MAATPVDPATETVTATARRAAAAAVERAAELAEQARTLKSRATDAAEEYRRTMRREFGRAVRRVEYVRAETAYRIQRAPFTAVAIACTAGFIAGAGAAWLALMSRDDA
jgi:ElaB/YqjD/DUF883 family membrane-anchored ribosome-binding protein